MTGKTGLGGEGGSTDVPFWIAWAVCSNFSKAKRKGGGGEGWLVQNVREDEEKQERSLRA